MSVLVRDMKMPERCLDCPMYDCYNYHCQLYAFGIPARYNRDGSVRPEWCELVELPEKHGRLIDADELVQTLDSAINLMESMLDLLELDADDGCLMELKAYRDIRDGIKELDAILEAEGE